MGQCVSPCQISSKSVEWLRRYNVLTAFKLAAICRIGFSKFNFFNGWGLGGLFVSGSQMQKEDKLELFASDSEVAMECNVSLVISR